MGDACFEFVGEPEDAFAAVRRSYGGRVVVDIGVGAASSREGGRLGDACFEFGGEPEDAFVAVRRSYGGLCRKGISGAKITLAPSSKLTADA